MPEESKGDIPERHLLAGKCAEPHKQAKPHSPGAGRQVLQATQGRRSEPKGGPGECHPQGTEVKRERISDMTYWSSPTLFTHAMSRSDWLEARS